MRRTVRRRLARGRRVTRRVFLRQAGALALAAPVGLGVLVALPGVADAAPVRQDGTPTVAPAAPTETAPPATVTAAPTDTPPPATATPTAVPPTSTAVPSATPAGPARPMPSAPGQPPTPSVVAPGGITRETVLMTLRFGHPRLLLLADDEARIRRALATDAPARAFRDALLRNGSRLLTQPTPERVLIGPRLLTVSRTVLDRVMTLALLYRLDGDTRWAQRAKEELRAAAAFSDWNPSHFLDVAEMTHAFAIGYDWLYDALADDDRAVIRRALVEKGLRPAEQQYTSRAFWTRATHNWNLVCNGGIAIGALAVGDEEPALAGTLLAQALASMPLALATYAPDGAWPEGPGYWEYGTLYLVSALAALTSALGTDFGLSDAPGLAGTGRYRLNIAGPTALYFNFADAGQRPGSAASLFWLARRYDDPVLAAAAREADAGRTNARDLLWYDPRGTAADVAALPLDARYQAAHLATFRSAWNDKEALFVGFKGGDNAMNHAHLDLGTFVLDALGERWASDLGPDDYDLPGYFGAERWTYERLKTSGQNTLVIDGANQEPRAVAPIMAFRTSGDGGFAVADLTAAYAASGATRVHRGVSLRDSRSRVLVQDEIDASRPVDLTWTIHTQASITVEADRATLTLGGAVLEARLLAPEGATFDVEDVQMTPPQQPAPETRRLLVRVPQASKVQIAVLFTPRRSLTVAPAGAASAGGAIATETPTATTTPVPTRQPLPGESLPAPALVDLQKWAASDVAFGEWIPS